ncbi:bifunctional diguanylate cyclase/phosphodiesterase [Sphingomonas nostoxanthinifaciens]|uniref:bifunctional diguanylate cyclase/phosphodiesterase n=1 Tax=Sphingomonas nostoxanthinifaciens TaxID=2872652 RepID=UPI001CC1F835|nr:EAL domain-containing protein [Sphingomonas nostoxanthinifaciens]UAK24310.1 EAL domain-containing protein [Sphingomonas nostoxanthinifaciens]
MLTVWYCIRDQHDWRLVALAGLISCLACTAAVITLRQQRGESQRTDVRWQLVAGIMTGFGIWSAHFVAMLGYDDIAVAGYAFGLTGLSLLVAIVMTTAGFALGSRPGARLRDIIGGGIVVGGGIATMHYLGMSSVQFAGHFDWSPPLVVLSILFAIGPTVPALTMALRRRDWGSGALASVALMLAILALHFTGMAAATVIPDAADGHDRFILSPASMGLAVSAIAAAVLVIGAGAAVAHALAVAAIRAGGREFRILVEGITDCALYMLDPNGRVASWNAGAQHLKGFTSEEAIGLHFSAFYSDEDRALGVPARALATARTTGKFTAEGWRYRRDRSRFWAAVTIEPVIGEQGDIIGFAKITRDVSRLKEDQDRMAALTRKLDAAVTNMQQGLVLFDGDERVALVNARFRIMYRIDAKVPLEGLDMSDFFRFSLKSRSGGVVSEDRVAQSLDWMRACLSQPQGGGSVTVAYEDASVVDASYRALPGGGVVATFEDVSERHRSEARIAHMALHDGLTGLPNRTNFNARLDAAIDRASVDGTKVGIIVIDLDGFKDINDTYGHAVGDNLLQILGARLKAAVGDDEAAARFGGDEFAALCIFRQEDELHAFVDRLSTLLGDPMSIDGLAITPAASLGVSIFPDDGQDRDKVLGNADLAMYRAKASPGMQVCHYENGMNEAARARRAMAKDLREAIPRDELTLAFQVQCSVQTGAVTGYEALLRWHHPTDGWISPGDFIPVAEESGSIIEIGEWVLRRACREAAGWVEPHRVAVNLSPLQFADRDLVTTLTEILLETGLPPRRLELEVTESAIIVDKAAALQTLRQIKALGVTIAIDDFGTGYASLEMLHAFPFDKIKIDRSFILQSGQSEQARAIIRAVIALGSSLNMPVLAEGVEDEEQLEMLRLEGCTEAQGFLLGRPSLDLPDASLAA